jgi:hypothetical protein
MYDLGGRDPGVSMLVLLMRSFQQDITITAFLVLELINSLTSTAAF